MAGLGQHAGRGLELLDREVRGHQCRVRLDAHGQAVTRLDARDMLALGVHQEVGDGDGRLDQNLARTLAGALVLDRAQDGQRQAVIAADQAGAVAMRTGLRGRFQHAGAQALARHLHQAEPRDAADLDAGAVGFQLVLDALFHGGVVATLVHVDEVDDDQPGQVAQAQLAGDLVGGLKVGLERGLLDRALLGGPSRVHVDGDQRLGDADDDVAARFQLHDRVEHACQIAFDLEAREQRHLVLVVLHAVGMRRHDHLHEVARLLIAALALDQHLVDVLGIQIADVALDQVAFLIDGGRCDRLEGQVADLLPQAQQVFVIAAYLHPGALAARGADDQTRALGHIKFARDVLEFLAIRSIGDLAADAAATRGVGHQDAVAAGQRQIGGQRGTLVATLLLDDLHQHDLADLDDLLDLVAARTRLSGRADLLGHVLVGDRFDLVVLVGRVLACVVGRRLVRGIDRLGAGLAARTATLLLGLLGLGIGAFLGLQRLAVGRGDLVIVRMDFREGQEAVAVPAVIHEGRLQRGLDPRDLGQVDVPGDLAPVGRLEIKFLDFGSIDHDHPSFLGMGGVDQHFHCHCYVFRAAEDRAAPSASPGSVCGVMRTRARHRRRRPVGRGILPARPEVCRPKRASSRLFPRMARCRKAGPLFI